MTDLFGHRPTIKALSLWQPWASLVGQGVKIDETRHWSTDYRGPIAIHAAKTLDVAGAPDALCRSVFGEFWPKVVPLGVVICVAELYDCAPAERVADHITPANLAAGNFARGRFAWRLRDVRRLRAPIPLTGRQGLYNWTPEEALEPLLGPPLGHQAACQAYGWAA